MHAIIEAIEVFLTETLGSTIGVMICAMIPIIELRGAIPLGAALGLPWWQSYLFAVLGNMLPVPFILLLIKKVIAHMTASRIKLFNKIGNWLTKKAEKNREKIEKYSFWGVCLFVAIPLPVTGAWTGSLVAATIDMKPFNYRKPSEWIIDATGENYCWYGNSHTLVLCGYDNHCYYFMDPHDKDEITLYLKSAFLTRFEENGFKAVAVKINNKTYTP